MRSRNSSLSEEVKCVLCKNANKKLRGFQEAVDGEDLNDDVSNVGDIIDPFPMLPIYFVEL